MGNTVNGNPMLTLENEERYPQRYKIILEPRTGEYGKRAEEAIIRLRRIRARKNHGQSIISADRIYVGS